MELYYIHKKDLSHCSTGYIPYYDLCEVNEDEIIKHYIFCQYINPGERVANVNPEKINCTAINPAIPTEEQILSFLGKDNSYVIKERTLGIGEYYPGISRPVLGQECQPRGENLFSYGDPRSQVTFHYPVIERIDYLSKLNQLELLWGELNEIFSSIEPRSENYNCYSHRLRNLIILSCTEVEAAFKDVLTKNGYTKSGNLNTSDFYKLLELLRLSEYSLYLKRYQEFALYPFKNWNPTQPTQSLIWYNAYQNIKHDRLKYFSQATLQMAILSLFGLSVLLISQHGFENVYWNAKISNYIGINTIPDWDFEDIYIPPRLGEEWKPVKAPLL